MNSGRTRPSVCAEPGCPTITTATRCTDHARAADQARGTRQQRGYDKHHDRLRRHYTPLVAAGDVTCWRCNEPIDPAEPWDLGHDDHDRTIHRGPEHRDRCNRAAAGRNSHTPGA